MFSSSIKIHDADGIGVEMSLPVYLLEDIRTAIAAGIFAMALQDNHHALVVGTGDTFGKGRIQHALPLNRSVVDITRVRHVTPSRGDPKHMWFYPLIERIQNMIS